MKKVFAACLVLTSLNAFSSTDGEKAIDLVKTFELTLTGFPFLAVFAFATLVILIAIRISTPYIGVAHKSLIRSFMAIFTPVVIIVMLSVTIPGLVMAYPIILLFSVMFILGTGFLASIGVSVFTMTIYALFFICFSENVQLIPLT